MVQIFVGLASLIHFYIFVMESLLWGSPRTNKTFGMSAESAAQNRLFAFNQGFYNLFLAIGAAVGMGLREASTAKSLQVYACLSMVGAALVLIYSQPKLVRAAAVQGLPPLLALIFMAMAV